MLKYKTCLNDYCISCFKTEPMLYLHIESECIVQVRRENSFYITIECFIVNLSVKDVNMSSIDAEERWYLTKSST